MVSGISQIPRPILQQNSLAPLPHAPYVPQACCPLITAKPSITPAKCTIPQQN